MISRLMALGLTGHVSCADETPHQGVSTATLIADQAARRHSRQAFLQRLQDWMDGPAAPPITQRLLYGSDYFMNGLDSCYQDYARNWISAFKEEFPGDWPSVVGGNAVDYLGLRQGRQRERVDGFCRRHHLTPEWTTVVADSRL